MGDAWDDDEFEVADIGGGLPEPVGNWDDEEEFEPPPVVPVHGEAPKLSKEKEAKRRLEAKAKKANDLAAALQAEETDEERRLRERNEIEDADHELTDDLFGGGVTEPVVKVVQGLDGYTLKSLKDHLTLAQDIVERVEKNKSKQNYIHAMLKELVKKLDPHLTPDDLGEIVGICTASKTAKEKLIRQPTAKKGQAKKAAKSKKQVKSEEVAHKEMFGGFVEDEYEDYAQEYDDFM